MASFDSVLREQISKDIDLETIMESIDDADIVDILSNEDGEMDGK